MASKDRKLADKLLDLILDSRITLPITLIGQLIAPKPVSKKLEIANARRIRILKRIEKRKAVDKKPLQSQYDKLAKIEAVIDLLEQHL